MAQTIIKISEEDKNKIEALHYKVEARANLLDRLTNKTIQIENNVYSFNKYLEEYDKCFKEYDKLKFALENKYKPEGNFLSWNIDFDNNEMIFEDGNK